jgi:hypothetical protein
MLAIGGRIRRSRRRMASIGAASRPSIFALLVQRQRRERGYGSARCTRDSAANRPHPGELPSLWPTRYSRQVSKTRSLSSSSNQSPQRAHTEEANKREQAAAHPAASATRVVRGYVCSTAAIASASVL